MTRKKTTTGTMGSKRKNESKAKTQDKATPPKVVEHKATEVIPAVQVALLAEHAQLPDRAGILQEFARDFVMARERATTAQAEEVARAEREAEAAKQRGAERKRRPTVEPLSQPRLVRSPSEPLVPRPVAPPAQPAQVETPWAEVIEAEPAPLPEPAVLVEAEPEPLATFATLEASWQESVQVVPEPERPSSDLFALLRNETPERSEDDFDFSFQTSADQSSPFVSSPLPVDDGATVMLEAPADEPDLGTPLAMEALEADAAPVAPFIAPSDSTTLIQAMPDDDGAEAGPARKARKTSKKRRG